jgi:hypothetical protein
MTETTSKQWQAVYAPADKEVTGKSSQNSDVAAIILQRELLFPEVIGQLEMQRRWDLILGPLGVA